MARFEIRLIENYNPPVPEFDSKGRPDLLGWDEDVASYSPDYTVMAVTHDSSLAARIEKIVTEEYADEENGDIVNTNMSFEEGYSLADWWDDYGEWFAYLDEYGLSNYDDSGNEYDWDNSERLNETTPSYHDFMTVMAHRAAHDVFDGNNNLDISAERKRRMNTHHMDQLWKLHDTLYQDHIEYGWLTQGGIEPSNVRADITVQVRGANKK